MNLPPTNLTLSNLKSIKLKAQWLLPFLSMVAIELPQTVNSVISIHEYVTSHMTQTSLPSKAADDRKNR